MRTLRFNILLFLIAVVLFAAWHLFKQVKDANWAFDLLFHWRGIRDALLEIPREIGVAIVIAIVLNVFVERINQRRQVE